MKMDLNETEFSTAKTTDPYDIYWCLAPRYFEELALANHILEICQPVV